MTLTEKTELKRKLQAVRTALRSLSQREKKERKAILARHKRELAELQNSIVADQRALEAEETAMQNRLSILTGRAAK